jgi:hypothetical protein
LISNLTPLVFLGCLFKTPTMFVRIFFPCQHSCLFVFLHFSSSLVLFWYIFIVN